MLASNRRDFAGNQESETGLRVSREALETILGQPSSSWFTDSSVTGFRRHFAWACGCNADKGEDVDRLCSYQPCDRHRLGNPPH